MMGNLTTTNDEANNTGIYLCDKIFNFSTISGAFFILIFIFSIIGNGLILCVLVHYENLKNVTNIFVLNVACSDLVFALTLPLWAVYYLHHWVFGDFTCKFMTAAYFVGLYSSVILITAMTVDRFTTVVLNISSRNCVRRQRCAKGACAAAWVISIAASLRNAINIKENYSDDIITCEDDSDGPEVKLGYYLQVSLLFFLPFAIIVFCYSAIVKTVLQSSNRKWHRTVIVIFCIVAAFFICWGPYNMMIFIEPWYDPDGCDAEERWNIAHSICQILAYSHCCLNPLLYLLSQKLRRQMCQFLHGRNVRRNNSENGKHSGSCHNVTFIAQNSTVML